MFHCIQIFLENESNMFETKGILAALSLILLTGAGFAYIHFIQLKKVGHARGLKIKPR